MGGSRAAKSHPPDHAGPVGRSPITLGFSVVELLVVIGIIALLIAFLLPTLNAARQQMITVKCLSQMRQLGIAFQMYASDNAGWMPSSDTCGPLRPKDFVTPMGQQTAVKWTGWVDGGSSSRAIENGTLWAYVKTRSTYRCPNDVNPYRLRSYSINSFIAPGSLITSPVVNAYKVYKNNQILSPAKTIIFAEEPDPRSILVGTSLVTLVGQWNLNGWSQNPLAINKDGAWGNLIAAWHNDGANFAFADGHAEYWKFKDKRTIDYLKNDPRWPDVIYKTPNNPDLIRISAAVATWPPHESVK